MFQEKYYLGEYWDSPHNQTVLGRARVQQAPGTSVAGVSELTF